MPTPRRTKHSLDAFKSIIRRIERGRDPVALRWQAILGLVDLSILAFFILGPYFRSGPSYLVVDYAIAVWIFAELFARAIAAPSLGEFFRRPMIWIDIAVFATLLFPDVLFNFAFLRVMLPLSVPALATLCIIDVLNTWNEFLIALVLISAKESRTVPVGLLQFQGEYSSQYTLLMAGILISIIPVIVIFIFLQRYFVKGLTVGGVKG